MCVSHLFVSDDTEVDHKTHDWGVWDPDWLVWFQFANSMN